MIGIFQTKKLSHNGEKRTVI